MEEKRGHTYALMDSSILVRRKGFLVELHLCFHSSGKACISSSFFEEVILQGASVLSSSNAFSDGQMASIQRIGWDYTTPPLSLTNQPCFGISSCGFLTTT
jgi:hypothetical protein